MYLSVNQIIQGDALDVLKTFPDESIDCIVTSPPYYGLRDYGTATWEGGDIACDHKIPESEKDPKQPQGTSHVARFNKENCHRCGAKRIDRQIGLESTLVEYLDKMLAVTAECKRVLKKTGTMWWNHGDSYGNSATTDSSTGGGVLKQQKGIRLGAVPEKCLALQAHRLAIRMIDKQKWTLRNQIIWHKPNCMPSSVQDRFTVDYEPIFFFTKSKKYWFEPQYEPMTERSDAIYRARIRMNKQYNSKEPYKNNTPYATNKISKKVRIGSTENPNRSFGDNNSLERMLERGRNKRCVWKIPTQPYPEAHFATFPPALVEIPIKAGCPEMIIDCNKCGIVLGWRYGTKAIYQMQKMWEEISCKRQVGPENDILWEAMQFFLDGGTQKDDKGMDDNNSWLQNDLDANSSRFQERRIYHGTSSCYGKDVRKETNAIRSSESYKLEQDRQSHRKSGIDGQKNSRQTTQTANKTNSMSSLWEEDTSIGSCPQCEGDIRIRRGIVCDIFMGSGTTGLMAKLLGRNYIGIELNKNYIKLAEERLAQKTLNL